MFTVTESGKNGFFPANVAASSGMMIFIRSQVVLENDNIVIYFTLTRRKSPMQLFSCKIHSQNTFHCKALPKNSTSNESDIGSHWRTSVYNGVLTTKRVQFTNFPKFLCFEDFF